MRCEICLELRNPNTSPARYKELCNIAIKENQLKPKDDKIEPSS